MLCELSARAMERATQALLGRDLTQAEHVISDDVEIDWAYAGFEEAACAVLALQAPVASELRAVVSMMQVGEKIMRMGDLARHVAEAARRRHPRSAVPAPLLDQFAEMSQLGIMIGSRVGHAVASRSTADIGELERLDDRVDALEVEVLSWVNTEQADVQAGVDVALLARYFERYADQGVAAARRLQFAVTGDHARVTAR
jgi:phosphate transport system protein